MEKVGKLLMEDFYTIYVFLFLFFIFYLYLLYFFLLLFFVPCIIFNANTVLVSFRGSDESDILSQAT